MYWQYGMSQKDMQTGQHLSSTLAQQLLTFLDPLLESFDAFVDKRLSRRLLDTVVAILLLRDRAKNLLLSELGAFIARQPTLPQERNDSPIYCAVRPGKPTSLSGLCGNEPAPS